MSFLASISFLEGVGIAAIAVVVILGILVVWSMLSDPMSWFGDR